MGWCNALTRKWLCGPGLITARNLRLSIVSNSVSLNAHPRSFYLDLPIIWVYQSLAMKGTNNGAWLVIGSKLQCGKSCLGEYCKVHNARLAKGGGTFPCTGCGKGVKNAFKVCMECGYMRVRMRMWQRHHRAFIAEFNRLATIEIYI